MDKDAGRRREDEMPWQVTEVQTALKGADYPTSGQQRAEHRPAPRGRRPLGLRTLSEADGARA